MRRRREEGGGGGGKGEMKWEGMEVAEMGQNDRRKREGGRG